MLEVGSRVLIIANNSFNGNPCANNSTLPQKDKYVGKTGTINEILERTSGPCKYAIILDDKLMNNWLWADCELIELTETNKDYKR